MLLSENNIRNELSYAYLHAVAATLGMACEVAGRHSDGDGVDATVRVRERLDAESIFTNFQAFIQLKATSQSPTIVDGRYSFWLKRDHYNKLRLQETPENRVLVVLFLPEDNRQWLSHSEECLISRRCAYWVSVRGASPCDSQTGQTVYVPQGNVFSPDSLRELMRRLSLGERITYDA